MIPSQHKIEALQARFPGMGDMQAINHLRGQALARDIEARERRAIIARHEAALFAPMDHALAEAAVILRDIKENHL